MVGDKSQRNTEDTIFRNQTNPFYRSGEHMKQQIEKEKYLQNSMVTQAQLLRNKTEVHKNMDQNSTTQRAYQDYSTIKRKITIL